MSFEDFFNSFFYIIDCENFTYFARKVKPIGISSGSYNEEICVIIDLLDPYCKEKNREMYLSELKRFKTYKEAQKYAKELNAMPENKKRKESYLKDFFTQEYLEFKNNRW